MNQPGIPEKKFPAVNFHRWSFPAIISIALVLRVSLLALPAPGRDEATYFYWAQYFEPAYSLLLQLLIKFFSFFPISSVVAQRLPSFICGMLVLVLLNKLLQQFEMTMTRRHILIGAVALTPWQTYVGAISHPDNIFLCVLLLIMIVDFSQKYWLSALLIGLSVLAKPTGLIVLGVGIVYYFRRRDLSVFQRTGLALLALLLASPALLTLNSPMLAAMAEFGRISGEIAKIQIVFISLLSLFGLGALLLPVTAMHVLKTHAKQAWQLFKSPQKTSLPLWIAVALILTFTAAALLRNQIKGNWLLPAFILLLPYCRMPLRDNLIRSNLVLSLLLSTGMALFFIFPNALSSVENSVQFLDRTYAVQAGTREARISTTSSWHDRLAEYQSLTAFAAEVAQFWVENQADTIAPQWLICDDYGLAAQLIFKWNKCQTRLVIPSDGIFRNGNTEAQRSMQGPVLIMGVHTKLEKLWPAATDIYTQIEITHPVTASKIELGIVEINKMPSKD